MDFLLQLLCAGIWLVFLMILIKLLICFPCKCPRKCFAVSIRFIYNGVSAVDTTIPLPGSDTANAVITQDGLAVPGAVFDADPSWAVADPTIISFSQTSVQTVLVTALALGQTTLTVDGLYLGNAVHGEAIVTVTQGPSGFGVNIQWSDAPAVAVRR